MMTMSQKFVSGIDDICTLSCPLPPPCIYCGSGEAVMDVNEQQLDLRSKNSWMLKLDEVRLKSDESMCRPVTRA